jgi:hypothetical protein
MMSEMDQDKARQDMGDDELLKGIVVEPGNPDVVVLTGVFLGRGVEANMLRLYTAMDLSQYFQLPKDKVLGVKRMPQGQVLVWVPRDLRVQLVASQTMAAEFLKGSIQSAYISRAQRGSSFGSLARSAARVNDPQPSVFGGPFCQTDIADPSNPICGLTATGCPPPPSC